MNSANDRILHSLYYDERNKYKPLMKTQPLRTEIDPYFFLKKAEMHFDRAEKLLPSSKNFVQSKCFEEVSCWFYLFCAANCEEI